MRSAALPVEPEARNRSIGVVLAVLGASLFSLKGVVIKLAYAEGIGVSQLLTLRMGFALPVYLAVGIIAFVRTKQKARLKLLSRGRRAWPDELLLLVMAELRGPEIRLGPA